MKATAGKERRSSGATEFGRRKTFKPPSPVRSIFIAAIIFSIVGAVLLFFVEPHYLFATIAVLVVVILILKYPVFGLYLYLLVSLLRPQDIIYQLGAVRPNISILAVSLISLIIHRKVKGEFKITLTTPDKAFGLFLVAVLLSNVTSFWVSYSINETIEFFKLVPFYLLAVSLLNSTSRIERYLRYSIYAMIFVCLVQIYTYHVIGLTRATGVGGYGIIFPNGYQLGGFGMAKDLGGSVYGVGGYSGAFLGNASELGLAAVMYFPISWYLFKISRSRWMRIFFIVATIILLYSVQVCGSRGAFLALVLTLLYALYKEKKLLIGLVCIIILAGPIYIATGDLYKERIASIAEGTDDESANIRVQLWKAGMRMLLANPAFGVGMSNFTNAYGGAYRAEGSRSLYWSPHNILIQVASETGLVGLMAYLAIFYAIGRTNRSTRRYASELPDKSGKIFVSLSNALDIALVGYFIAGQFITATYYPHLFQMAFLSSSLYITVRRKVSANRKAEIEEGDNPKAIIENSGGS